MYRQDYIQPGVIDVGVFRKYTKKSLFSNRVRTIVTIIGIVLSVSLFTAVAEGLLSQDYLSAHRRELRTANSSGPFRLRPSAAALPKRACYAIGIKTERVMQMEIHGAGFRAGSSQNTALQSRPPQQDRLPSKPPSRPSPLGRTSRISTCNKAVGIAICLVGLYFINK